MLYNPWSIVQGTREIQGIALDYKEKMPVSDPSRWTISWSNFTRMLSSTALAILLNEICKKYIRHREREDEGITLDTTNFQQMINLRLLQINRVRLQGQFRFLPQSIKWLQWKECPLRVLSSDICPRELAVLDLSEGKMERLWRAGYRKVCFTLQIFSHLACL